MRKRTLLLVFIHGFKGGDDTFRSFPSHLRALLGHGLCSHGLEIESDVGLDVVAITYPKFETRGELGDCVARFREWLQNKVIDLEVANGTPSPTLDPSVYTVLVGHSMGGIVGAETILQISGEKVLPRSNGSGSESGTRKKDEDTRHGELGGARPTSAGSSSSASAGSTTAMMFPSILGLLAYDTPFLGISPGVIAHGAEGHYKTASGAYKALTEVSSAFGWGSTSKTPSSSTNANKANKSSTTQPMGLLSDAGSGDAAAAPRWQSWGKYAMFAGAAGAAAAGGAAALYSQRDRINSGWGWVSGHLEFVGVLVKGEEMKGRIERVGKLSERGILEQRTGGLEKRRKKKKTNAFAGSAVFYTVLGRSADKGGQGKRTFVKLPPSAATTKTSKSNESKTPQRTFGDGESGGGLRWLPAVNEKAVDEISAHTSMFSPRENPGFYTLGEKSVEVLLDWVQHSDLWEQNSDTADRYGTSNEAGKGEQGRSGTSGSATTTSDGQSSRGDVSNTDRHLTTTIASTSTAKGDEWARERGEGGGGKTYGEIGNDGWEQPDYEDGTVRAKVREKQVGEDNVVDLSQADAEAVWVHAHEEHDRGHDREHDHGQGGLGSNGNGDGDGDEDGDLRMRDDEDAFLGSSVVIDRVS